MTPLRPEGPRYRAALVFVPGLWADPAQWRRAGEFLAHRGWEGFLADPGADAGDTAARTRALRRLVAELERPVVLVAQDGAGPVALQAAAHADVAAVVWAGPLWPGGGIRRAVNPWRVLAALVWGAAPPRPPGWTAELREPAWARPTEPPGPVVDLVRGRVPVAPGRAPTALVVGGDDALCDAAERAQLQRTLAADLIEVPGAARFPLAGPQWRHAASLVHRFLVQRLGEGLLEYYDEAMSERGDEEEEPG